MFVDIHIQIHMSRIVLLLEQHNSCIFFSGFIRHPNLVCENKMFLDQISVSVDGFMIYIHFFK